MFCLHTVPAFAVVIVLFHGSSIPIELGPVDLVPIGLVLIEFVSTKLVSATDREVSTTVLLVAVTECDGNIDNTTSVFVFEEVGVLRTGKKIKRGIKNAFLRRRVSMQDLQPCHLYCCC